MELEERVEGAKLNKEQKDDIIREYANFIRARASNTMNRVVTERDDEYSIALIAFNEAIDTYDKTKGNFLAFAALVIRNRLLNYDRTESRHRRSIPFSSLGTWDKEGNEMEFEIEDTRAQINNAALEIQAAAEQREKERAEREAERQAAAEQREKERAEREAEQEAARKAKEEQREKEKSE